MPAQGQMHLTKSRFVDGWYCPRTLWYAMNEPSKLPGPADTDLARMDEGSAVGEKARELYPDGILIEGDFNQAIKQTQRLLHERKPLFEPTVVAANGYCKADILVPAPEGEWDLIEVKASNRCKEYHLVDIAFQIYVLRNAGLSVRAAKIMHLDPSYVREGPLDLDKVFTTTDVTEKVLALLPEVPGKMKELFRIIGGMRPAPNRVHICGYPHGECPTRSVDIEELPAGNVTELARGGEKVLELLENDILLLKDIPDGFNLTERQRIQVNASKTGKPHIDRESIRDWLKTLRFPLYHFDFETFQRALPPFDRTYAWQQIPFQFSLHIEGTRLDHEEFLAQEGDPREHLADALSVLEGDGNIVVFNASFEKKIIRELAEQLGRKELLQLNDRIIDLATPFRKFWYYHPAQRGSTSLKRVLPVLTDLSYDDMEICQGDIAAMRYVKNPTDAPTRQALLKYCGQDTLAMVKLLARMKELC